MMQLAQGHTAAQWPSWDGGSWEEREEVLGEPQIQKTLDPKRTNLSFRSKVSCAGPGV